MDLNRTQFVIVRGKRAQAGSLNPLLATGTLVALLIALGGLAGSANGGVKTGVANSQLATQSRGQEDEVATLVGKLREALKKDGNSFLPILSKLEAIGGEFPVEVLPDVTRKLNSIQAGASWEEGEANARALSAYLNSTAKPHAEAESRAALKRSLHPLVRRCVEDLESRKAALLFANLAKLDALIGALQPSEPVPMEDLPNLILGRFTGKSSWVAVAGGWCEFLAERPATQLVAPGHETLERIGDQLANWAKKKPLKTTWKVLDQLLGQESTHAGFRRGAREGFMSPYERLGPVLDEDITKIRKDATKKRNSKKPKGRKADFSAAAEAYESLAKTLEESIAYRQTYVELLPFVVDALHASALEDNESWRAGNTLKTFRTKDFDSAIEWSGRWIASARNSDSDGQEYSDSLSSGIDIHLDFAWHYATLCASHSKPLGSPNKQAERRPPKGAVPAGGHQLGFAEDLTKKLARTEGGEPLARQYRAQISDLQSALQSLRHPPEPLGGFGR